MIVTEVHQLKSVYITVRKFALLKDSKISMSQTERSVKQNDFCHWIPKLMPPKQSFSTHYILVM